MTEGVSEALEGIWFEIWVVIQDVVMGWPRSAFDTLVWTKIEVELKWVNNIHVNNSTLSNIKHVKTAQTFEEWTNYKKAPITH